MNDLVNAVIAIMLISIMIGIVIAVVYATMLMVPIIIFIGLAFLVYSYLKKEPSTHKSRRKRRKY